MKCIAELEHVESKEDAPWTSYYQWVTFVQLFQVCTVGADCRRTLLHFRASLCGAISWVPGRILHAATPYLDLT